MKMSPRRSWLLTLALFALPALVHADHDYDDDPPGRVARLSYFSGSVSFRPASVDDWGEASLNYPLSEGDHLWTDDGARSELHVGSTIVRLAPRTAFSFLNLDDDNAQMRISEGGVAVTIDDLDRDEVVEVDSPDAAVSLVDRGFYVVRVSEDGYETTVTVRRGVAEVTAGGASVTVHSGDSLVIQGGDSPRYDVRDAYAANEWEDWCVDRDRRYERSESRRYVSHRVIGYQDLDDHGRWRYDDDYGNVWVPSYVAVDWAPYRYGHWAYVSPWGWTWIDNASWGFAPFHYGRWAHRPWGWCWVPGTVVARPVYAPALVAFVGGNNFAVSVSVGGGVGWFPLGPREVYVPPYRHSNAYIRNVNVTNVNVTNINVTNVNVTNVNYMNRHVGGAVTVVDRDTFVSARPVNRAVLRVSEDNLRRASVQTGVVAVKPRRESVLGPTVNTAVVRKPTVSVQERAVVTRVKPPVEPRRRTAETIEGVRVARVKPQLVKPAVEEGRNVRLRPAREGLPEARKVQVDERPRPVVQETKPKPGRPETKPTERPNVDERVNHGRPHQFEDSSDRRPKPDVSERPTAKPTERPNVDERVNHGRPHQFEDPSDRRPKPDVSERPTPKPTERPNMEERGNGREKPEPTRNERPTPQPTREPEKDDSGSDKGKDKPKATATPKHDRR
jgi:hypothetical protein